MNELLTDLLLSDHRRIQSMGTELQKECGSPANSESACFGRFRNFKAQVAAHTKAEEFTVYAVFEENAGMVYEQLRKFVLEAYEEHDLIYLLLKEMGQAEELTDQFRAKLKVLMDLLVRHLAAEESIFLPQVREKLTPQQQTDLAVVYARERDQIFAKKSGLKKPASAHISRDLNTH